MLYKKNSLPRLPDELFQNPTSEYRGAPFWAWNCKLNREELESQLDILKKMGFGGAHMHVRSGMATPYLSEEFMDLIKACVSKAKRNDMLAWLYDEDRWPSGAAGGLVTKDPRFRGRYLLFTPTAYCGIISKEKHSGSGPRGTRSENGILLTCYDIEFDHSGALKSWRTIDENEPPRHEKWYAYLETLTETPWFNNQTYVNTLDRNAMDAFIDVTYERYHHAVSGEFGNSVPAIFTDEPQFPRKEALRYATEKADVTLPWTDDLPQTFADTYAGEDLLAGLPELIWERADGQPSVIRYHYHDHVCERFTQAFADNCGKWCREHGLALTGHMMEEPTLHSQTAALGEAMRSYRSFGLPGIDILFARFEYTTAKQAQSALHQYGKEGMLSELYGVTNWDFDFRSHKLHGDWQAALGVTIRVPHLSLVSLAGEAKRDYPASINYQSPWWEKYSLVENHFSRLNTALSRGRPVVKVGVIHPIESYWLHWGPTEQTALIRQNMDEKFQTLTKWLLFGGIDFDFISESLLPDLCPAPSAPLQVGEMHYDAIIVPSCETLRTTTYDRLEAFAEAGGQLIIAGPYPALENAIPSNRGRILAENAFSVAFDRIDILQALDFVRLIEIRDQDGMLTDNLLHQLRQDKDGLWLFLAHGTEPDNIDISWYQDLTIRVKGVWKVSVYDTNSGFISDASFRTAQGETMVYHRMYAYDSLLFWLEQAKEDACCSTDFNGRIAAKTEEILWQDIPLPASVTYTRDEPNVLLLDQAEYALDDGPWMPKEEILRLDDHCRELLHWPSRKSRFAQPWAIPEEPITHTLHLRWHIHSEIYCDHIQLAIEDAETLCITWNGETVPNTTLGWYADKSIRTLKLPKLITGDNILTVDMPFGKRTNVEWAYLLGDFGVEVYGSQARIVPERRTLAFGSIVHQGLPFYGGNLTYHIPFVSSGKKLRIRSNHYRGILQTAQLDDDQKIPIIYPPYIIELENVSPGSHTLNLTLYGHRRNTMGPVHLADTEQKRIGPPAWRTEGEAWCYEYMLAQEGIMTSPQLSEEKYR